MELYWRLPVRLQEATLAAYARHLDGLYYGSDFESWRRHFEAWKDWSAADIEAWQRRQLTEIVNLAGDSIPYYREAWRNQDWKRFHDAKDLGLLPLLDRQSIRRNERSFVVEGLDPKSLWVEKTSGTTGTSLRIYWPTEMLPRFYAITEVMIRNPAGVGQGIPRAMMGGRPIVRGSAASPPYWRFNRRWRQLYLSSYHVSRTSAPGYIAALRHYRSEWMTGYGSAIAALAESALEAGVPPHRLRAVIVSGDTLLPAMRASIERFFQCRCFDSYGQSEGVATTMECAFGRKHVLPAVGILEILREDGSACAPGEVGEIVATTLLNRAMPLIRYRTGDRAAWAADHSCACGAPGPIVESLEGRIDDYLEAMDGRRIGRLSTAVKRSPSIHSAQIVQDRPGHAYLLVRPGEGYRPVDAVSVRDDLVERVGSFEFEIVEVKEIPRTPAGKTKLVVRLSEGGGPDRTSYDFLVSRGGFGSTGTATRKVTSEKQSHGSPMRDPSVGADR
jgi:phenylacetate-CoA ligase